MIVISFHYFEFASDHCSSFMYRNLTVKYEKKRKNSDEGNPFEVMILRYFHC